MAEENKGQQVTEDEILDFALQYLYANLSKNEVHFENEIIASTKLTLDEYQVNHIRELLLNTNLVQASIGFGKVGNMYLNASGIAVMKKYGNYANYLASQTQMPFSNIAVPEKKKPTKPTKGDVDFMRSVGEDD
jgi:hypothetical protein